MALILSSKLLLGTHLKVRNKSYQSTSMTIVLSMTLINVSKIFVFVTTSILDNYLPLAHNPIFAKRKHIPIFKHETKHPKHDIKPKNNTLHVDDDNYLEHGEREKNYLDIVMNINHCTSKMRTIAFQVQEHGIQHGEHNIFQMG